MAVIQGHGTAIVGTVSGTAISFGTAVVFEAASAPYISLAPLTQTKTKLFFPIRDGWGLQIKVQRIVGTVSVERQ